MVNSSGSLSLYQKALTGSNVLLSCFGQEFQCDLAT
jgi:hypothetical protein